MSEYVAPVDAAHLSSKSPVQLRRYRWTGKVIALAVLLAISATYYYKQAQSVAAVAAPPPALVTVSAPLERGIERKLGFLGQFSAVNRVELRAQVGGVLTHIHFKDGDTVHKGDLLFEIDPEPYE